MRVSQNEVYRMAQRALEGAGAPYGIDRDGAQSVAWLAARDLPGLAMLAAALDAMEGAFAPILPPHQDGTEGDLDLAGRPALVSAGSVMDCFALQLGDGQRAALQLRRCRWPLFLLPLAASHAAHSRAVKLTWQAGAMMLTCIAAPAGQCRIVLEGGEAPPDALFLDAGPATVMLETPTRNVRATPRTAPQHVIDTTALDEALRRSLGEGITVDDGVWARVMTAARRVLVPASEESRSRGAGGGDANA